MSNNENGNYFWRGTKKIHVQREKDVFTAIVKNTAEIPRLEALPGVKEVKQLHNGIFKIIVESDKRDQAMDMYRSGGSSRVAHHAYNPTDSPNTRYYITDKIIVKFKEGTSKESIEALLEETKTRIVKEYRENPNTFLLQISNESGSNPIKIANRLSEKKETVVYAEPNLINRYSQFYIPSDDLFENQWHLQSWEGPQLAPDADISVTKAWDITRGERSITVAIMDDGVDFLNHPDFIAENKIIAPKDFIDGDSNPFPVAEANDYHGTPCAGVAVAEENGNGVVGVAPGCALMPIRFPLSADDDLLNTIYDYIGKRADVLSCSWGPVPLFAPINSLIHDKLHELSMTGGPRQKGVVVVFAAGNYNCPLNDPSDNNTYKYYLPGRGVVETQSPILNGEACHPDVIAVSASTSINKKAAYSNWGKEISVCAPSNNFDPLTLSPLPGRGIWTTDNEIFGVPNVFTPGSVYTDRFGGTSSAAPTVAGVAALILSANPELSAKEVKQIIEETADKITDDTNDPILNVNMGTYNEEGHSEWFGYGKINAFSAVNKAKSILAPLNAVSNRGNNKVIPPPITRQRFF